MSIKVRRNGFGPQRSSFESNIDISNLNANTKNGKPFHAVFIRAPLILSCSPEVESLAELELDSGDTIVIARQNNMLVSTFHPELTGDMRIHRYFLEIVRQIL
jgi:5'-phosphate synthase pdxT subunit